MRFAILLIAAACAPLPAGAAEPRVLLDGARLELVAREPEIVTPIGMAFDARGRLLVIESHTHQRPADYSGPQGDRIRMFADSDGDGRLDRWSTFAQGYQQAMNLCVRPGGGVYLVTRRDVRLLEDTDDDGASDKETIILRLDTEGDYPHNGLSGIAFHPAQGGTLAVGIGENSGIPYTLVGSDGATLDMHEGAGAVYACAADGSGVRRLATGFWNPFSLCYAGLHLYCVDNDPDARPPCRLIAVQAAGDYGFRYQYGRAGVHPLLAWNGELPGTLPAICGVGEAPTAIVLHRAHLWVTSWGDHRLERYAPEADAPGGAQARREVIVQGDADFRPTGCAVAPDGSLYFGDWVSRSYPVHGQGRIWRLAPPPSDAPPADEGLQPLNADSWARDLDPRTAARQWAIFTGKGLPKDAGDYAAAPPELRLDALSSLRWRGVSDPSSLLAPALLDANPDVRLAAVRWIADERLVRFRDDVARLLEGDIPTERYFLAVLGAVEWLDGNAAPRSSGISDALLQRELANPRRSPQLHALALRLISPDHKWLSRERLLGFLQSDAAVLRREALRTIAMQTGPERFALLAEIAGDPRFDSEMRADAVAGLAADVSHHEALLAKLAGDRDAVVAGEAARVLRLSRPLRNSAEPLPAASDLEAWTALAAHGGDPESGRRLFFMAAGPQCAACHQHRGRGGRVGPDLTQVGRQQDRARILASILQPSRDIAPHYQPWELRSADGLTRVGLRLPQGGDDGVEPYADAAGRRFELRSEEIELRTPADASIMPEGLAASLNVQDIRDIVAFLAAGE
ncbi:MAG TPA: PVC-type heme-binding CxxCH protein [Lacipirellulaceae bacterium]|nr:PVC-type heme-binding CxxCH protein [Lacipirellulaceae bacterium]